MALQKWNGPMFNKLSPNFDMTAVFVLDGLESSVEYEYRCGWFFAEAELEKVQLTKDQQIEWPAVTHRFSTANSLNNARQSFIVGSCRYLLRLFGGYIFDDRGGKVFRSILEQIDEKAMPVDAHLMIGDQIYGDDLNFAAPDRRLDQFLERYRAVFSQKYIQQLMARIPTYMILDDHEIEDNWPAKATNRDRATLYPHAIHAYQIYQCSHSPLFPAIDGRIEGTLSHFWYSFAQGCAECFVMDARTERSLSEADRRMIKNTQMSALLSWLNNGSGKVKLVVSSVLVFPDLANDSDDKWGAFRLQRKKIIDFVANNKIRKVIFVSGDVHCSFVCELRSSVDPDFRLHSVVSSSLFWPYPHTEQSDFLFGQPLAGDGAQYSSNLLSPTISTDNFARISVELNKVEVTYYERKGCLLGESTILKF